MPLANGLIRLFSVGLEVGDLLFRQGGWRASPMIPSIVITVCLVLWIDITDVGRDTRV